MTSEPREASAATNPEDMPVGQGPLYEAIRAEASKLVPLFVPGGVERYQSWWGAGICGVTREDDGQNVVHVETFGKEKGGLGVRWPVTIEHLRASAISLLVYCEAHDAAE